jgi:hypothetical protein
MTDQAAQLKEINYLEMSDEELLKVAAPTGNFETVSETSPDKSEEDSVQTEEASDTESTDEEIKEETKDIEDASDDEEKTEVVDKFADTKDDESQTDVSTTTTTDTPTTESKETKDSNDTVDYKAEYEKVFAPFKANGREITIKNADDAITLMQMGANYNKKMAALKPNLQLLKLLEKNNLLDESKLSYLIDLEKKNPEAINKLIKDSGIDPMDLDAEKASGYKPNTYTVDEKELELDMVLEEIQDTDTYTRTLEVVGNKWDGASKRAVAEAPQLLKVINGHMMNGVYDIISTEVDRERTFGRLNGLSDIEAYKKVGDAIQARNGFDHLFQNSGNQTPPPPKVITPKPKAEDDGKLRDKKRAASSTKPVAANSVAKDFNPLALSDEDFSKMGIAKFL